MREDKDARETIAEFMGNLRPGVVDAPDATLGPHPLPQLAAILGEAHRDGLIRPPAAMGPLLHLGMLWRVASALL